MARYVARERVLGLRRGVVCDGALRGRERVASGVCLTSWLGSYICSKMLSAAREEMREEGASAAAAQQPGGAGTGKSRPRQVKNYSPGYMEQAPSRGHEASPQSGLGVC